MKYQNPSYIIGIYLQGDAEAGMGAVCPGPRLNSQNTGGIVLSIGTIACCAQCIDKRQSWCYNSFTHLIGMFIGI